MTFPALRQRRTTRQMPVKNLQATRAALDNGDERQGNGSGAAA